MFNRLVEALKKNLVFRLAIAFLLSLFIYEVPPLGYIGISYIVIFFGYWLYHAIKNTIDG